MKKEWKTPELEVVKIEETMASTWWGPHDEAYNGDPTGPIPHHGS